MRRYGDNISREDEEEVAPERPLGVFLGGCAAAYGSFPSSAHAAQSSQAGAAKGSWSATLFSLLGLRRSATPGK